MSNSSFVASCFVTFNTVGINPRRMSLFRAAFAGPYNPTPNAHKKASFLPGIVTVDKNNNKNCGIEAILRKNLA